LSEQFLLEDGSGSYFLEDGSADMITTGTEATQ